MKLILLAISFVVCVCRSYALPSTKELGFSEMSFMRSPKTSAYEQRSLAAGTEAMSNMMMNSRYYRYSARELSLLCAFVSASRCYHLMDNERCCLIFVLGVDAIGGMCDIDAMVPHDLRHGPVGESELASAVTNLRCGLRSATLSCCACDICGLFSRKFQLGAHEPMGFWELSHVVRKTAGITEVSEMHKN
eukprot:COSAG02_NODE_358_length_23882_cov_25.508683_4_plen_191_part_00